MELPRPAANLDVAAPRNIPEALANFRQPVIIESLRVASNLAQWMGCLPRELINVTRRNSWLAVQKARHIDASSRIETLQLFHCFSFIGLEDLADGKVWAEVGFKWPDVGSRVIEYYYLEWPIA